MISRMSVKTSGMKQDEEVRFRSLAPTSRDEPASRRRATEAHRATIHFEHWLRLSFALLLPSFLYVSSTAPSRLIVVECSPLALILYRKQPNEQTWSHQRSQWIRLILAHSRYHKVHTLALSEETCSASELFHNRSISRAPLSHTFRVHC